MCYNTVKLHWLIEVRIDGSVVEVERTLTEYEYGEEREAEEEEEEEEEEEDVYRVVFWLV